MAFPVDGGYGSGYSAGAGGGDFIPEIWSGKLLVKFYPASVLAAISNTDYEGEISSMGDKVRIRTTPDVTINDYSIGEDLTATGYQKLTSTPTELLIDKGKWFGFVLDDVDKYQSDINLMDDWATDASEQMKIAVDTSTLLDIAGDAHASNRGATAGAISGNFNLGTGAAPTTVAKTTVMDTIVDLGTVLDEQNVPENNRALVVPAKFAGLIKKSDLKDASLAGDGTSIFRNGRIGMVDRFEVYISNNLPTNVGGTNFVAYACQRHALSFAAQMTNMETLRAESTFGNIVRGLNVYGYKVLKPEALAELIYTYA